MLFLFVTLGTGVLISSVSQTQGQAIQLAILTMLPQFLLSGLFFPLYAMPWGVRWIGYRLPLTYFIKIARGVMVRGAPIGALWLPHARCSPSWRSSSSPCPRYGSAATSPRPADRSSRATVRRRPAAATPPRRPRHEQRGTSGAGGAAAADGSGGRTDDWGVRHLTVRYGKRTALRDVDLDGGGRAVTAVIGGDGAGKCTLLRALAGGLAATSGTVTDRNAAGSATSPAPAASTTTSASPRTSPSWRRLTASAATSWRAAPAT